MSKREKIILLILSALNFTHIMDFMIMMPLGKLFIKSFHINAQEFSYLVASYSIAAFVSSFAASFYADRFDRKKILLISYSGFTLATILCGLAPSYLTLLIARVVAGLFGGLIGAQVLSIVADLFEYERRGRAMGYVITAFSLASALGVPAGYYIANHSSWHVPFLVIGGLELIILPFIFLFIPPINKHLLHGRAPVLPLNVLQAVAKDRVQLNALALMGFLMMGHFLIIPFLIPYLETNVGFTKEQTPLFYIVGGIMTFFASAPIGKLSDRYGKEKIFRIFLLCSLPFIFIITNLPALPFYYVLFITGIWFVTSTGRSIPAQAMISNVVSPEQRGGFMSINSSMQQLFVGMASLLAGWIVKTDVNGHVYHYPVVGYLSIVLVSFCLFLVRFLQKRIRQLDTAKKESVRSHSELPLAQ